MIRNMAVQVGLRSPVQTVAAAAHFLPYWTRRTRYYALLISRDAQALTDDAYDGARSGVYLCIAKCIGLALAALAGRGHGTVRRDGDTGTAIVLGGT